MRGRRVALIAAMNVFVCLATVGCGGGGSSTPPLAVLTTALPDGTVGVPYTPQLQATGGTPGYTWSQTSGGTMPDGVTLSSSGQFSGTPTVPGSFGPYVFQVKDSASTAVTADSVSLTINIAGVNLAVTTSSLPDGPTGAVYSTSLAAAGGAAPYTWAETSGGAMPPGISDITVDGIIAGTPTAPGTYGPYVFTVTDSKSGTAASASMTITITGTAAIHCTPLGNEAALNSATPYAFQLQGTDGRGNPVDIVGSFTPNGSGGITAGSVDYNGYSTGSQEVHIDPAGSSYSLGTAPAGCLSLAFATSSASSIVGVTGVTFSFTLASLDGSGVYHSGRIIESDNASGINATGSMHLQTPTDFVLSSLQPRLAFGVDGWIVAAGNARLSRTTFAGSFSNSNGVISGGHADLNEGGTPSGALVGGTGQLGAIDPATGRGIGSFSIPASIASTYTFNFTFYAVNSSELYLLSLGSPVGVGAPALLSGTALVSSSSFNSGALSGYYLVASEGLNTSVPNGKGKNAAQIATLNATSAGTIPAAKFYINDAGLYSTPTYTDATYSVDPASGRTALTTSTHNGLAVVYLTAGSPLDEGIAGFVVGTDATAQAGVMVSQSATPPNYNAASVTGDYASSTSQDVDGANGAFLGAFTFDGAGGYTVVSKTTGPLTNFPSSGTVAINPDGSGSLDGGSFPLVTNGSVLFAIPNSGDPLVYVLTN